MHVPPGTTAAVIPAHNEEAVIEATLRSVLTNYLPQDVYVFCDGCTDQTAAIDREREALEQHAMAEVFLDVG